MKTPGETTIVSAEAKLIRIPLERPATDASNIFDVQEVPLTIITDKEGNRGIGFGYTIGRGGSTILELLRTELLPYLVGMDSQLISGVGREIKRRIHTIGSGTIAQTALATIDVALWDLLGKRTRTPVHILLGGSKREVPVYNTDVGWLNRPLHEMILLSEKALSEGFRAFKLKIGKADPEEDVERVAKMRQTLGTYIPLMLDANQAWTVEEAIPRLKRLERFDLLWVEEPIRTDFIQDYSVLRNNMAIPIAGGESLSRLTDFYEIARTRSFDILQPDVARVGGITEAMKVCAIGAAAGMKVAPHVSPELSLVVAAAAENSFYVEYIPQMNAILKHHLCLREGKAIASELPGLGIEFDEEALSRFEVHSHAVAA